MEDMKWLLKRCGFPILILLTVVIAGMICWGLLHTEEKKVAEEVWEPLVEIEDSETVTEEENDTETSIDSAYWFIPQASDCLILEEEKEQLQSTVLSAAESVREIYKDIVIADAPSYSSGINEFTHEQRKAVVEQLGRSGLVSVEEDTAMQNHEVIETFYADYLDGRDSMVTVFEVYRDGLIGAVTFIYRKGELQTYYIGIRWKEGGIPEIQGTSVSNVAEIKLTEKGYFIYAYESNSVIGRSGMEGFFESELKGQNGCRIYIVNSEGKEKEELACILVQHGQHVQLTIDADLQISLYEQFKEDKSCSVAMNPYTGEVLALVSTPAYDNNDFIMGLSSEQWTALNEDENKLMYNRFRQVWCPGSTFKPITAAVGLESGTIDPMEDYKVKGVMGCANRHVEEETLIKAYLMAWNALVENREDFMEQWTEQLQSENLLEGYRAEKFIEYTDGAEPLTEMDTDFMLKTLDHIKVFEDGTLLVVFLDGTEIECKNEEE